MSRAIPPDKRASLAAGFVLNTLDELEAKEFSRLATEDPALLEEVKQLQYALEESYETEEVAPPVALRDRLLAEFSNQPTEPALSPQKSVANRSASPAQTSRRSKILGSLVALLAAALAASNYFWWQSRQQLAQPSSSDPSPNAQTNNPQLPSQTYQLEATEAGTVGTVEVATNPNTLAATLTADGLPLIASDRTYVLWTVLSPDAPYTTDDKSAVLTTTFTVDSQGETQQEILLPPVYRQPDTIEALAVTVESAAAPQQHENSPILITRLQD